MWDIFGVYFALNIVCIDLVGSKTRRVRYYCVDAFFICHRDSSWYLTPVTFTNTCMSRDSQYHESNNEESPCSELSYVDGWKYQFNVKNTRSDMSAGIIRKKSLL